MTTENVSETRIYNRRTCSKKLIIVAGPVCSGKTTVAKNLARNIPEPFYLDKDELVYCTYPVFEVAGQTIDRHGDFFKANIRDPEYVTTNKLALAGLRYNSNVIVNAPYNSELHSTSGKRYEEFCKFADSIHALDGELIVVYSQISWQPMKERFEERYTLDPEAAKRDAELRNRLEEYCRKEAKPAPKLAANTVIDKMFVFDADNAYESFDILLNEMEIAKKFSYDAHIKEHEDFQIIAD